MNLSLKDLIDNIPTERGRVEGEAIVEARHIVMCGALSRLPSAVEIRGLCLQTTALKSYPHEISISLKNDTKLAMTGSCSCKAGAGGQCKHIAAMLIYCYRTGLGNLDLLSSTDIKQVWGRSKPSEIIYDTEVTNLCHVTTRRTVETDDAIVKNLAVELLLSVHDCEAAMHLMGRREDRQESYTPENLLKISLAEALLNVDIGAVVVDDIDDEFYIDKIRLNDEEAKALILSPQGSDEWTLARKRRITASSAYTLFTYANNKNPDWPKKLSSVFLSKFCGNVATMHGLKYESAAKIALTRQLERTVEDVGLLVNPCLPWLGGSPDGIIWPDLLVEIKCPLAGRKLPIATLLPDLKYLVRDEEGNFQLKKKHSYYAQIQINLFLTGLKKCVLGIYAPVNDSLQIVEVHFDEIYVHNLVNCLVPVYFNHVLPFIKMIE